MPRSIHDSRIFSNSVLNKKLRDSSIPKCSKTTVAGEAALSYMSYATIYYERVF